jgi:hypothetical protein
MANPRRNLVIDPAARTVLPPGIFADSLQPKPFLSRIPLQETRIDITLPFEEQTKTVDFYIPDESAFWEDWSNERVTREAYDSAEHVGVSECVTLEGSSANIRVVNAKTNRVMENQNRMFRFAIDHEIDSMPVEPVPQRVTETHNPIPDRIREAAAAARRAGVNQRTTVRVEATSERRSPVPWGYVAGLATMVVLFALAKFHVIF